MAPKENSQSVAGSRPNIDVFPNNRSISSNRIKLGSSMDDIFDKIGFGAINYFLILISGIVLGAVLLETCAISFVIPVSECDMKLTSTDKGILAAVSFSGMICSSHLWGYLADTKGRRFVILPTLMITFALAVVSSFTKHFYIFAILRFLNGFFISGSSATIYAYLGEFHSNSQRSRAIMLSSVIYGIMCTSMPLIAWAIINEDWHFYIPYIDIIYKPWRFFLIACSLPGFLAAIVLLFMPESPKFVLGLGDQKGAIKILEKMNRWNNGSKSELGVFEIEEEIESIENRKRIVATRTKKFPLFSSVYNQTAPIFKSPFLSTTILICTLQFFVYATSNGFYMFFNEIMNRFSIRAAESPGEPIRICDAFHSFGKNGTESMHIDAVNSTCITKLETATLEQDTLLEVIHIVGFVLIGMIINKIGKLPILLFLFGLSGTCGIICTMTDIPLVQKYSFMALMMPGIGATVISAAAVEAYPTSSRGMGICIALMFGRLGAVFGTNVVALLLENYCESTFYLSGSSILACGFLAIFLPKARDASSKDAPTIDRRISISSRI